MRPGPTCQATNRFLVEYEGLAQAYGSDTIDIRWYRLKSDGRPLAQVMPNIVEVEPYPELEAPVRVWPCSRRRIPHHPPAPRRRGASGEPEDAAEAITDGHSSADEGELAADAEEEAATLAFLEEALRDGGALDDGAFGLKAEEEAPEADPGAAPSEPQPTASAGPSAPPPPPPPVVPGGAAPRGAGVAQRRGADVTMQGYGGSISFYPSKQAFEAVCDNRGHGRCVATRTCRGKGKGPDGFRRGGRPVGFLAAWLKAGEHVASKEEHWLLFDNPVAERMALRRELSETEAGRMLASRERPRDEGEPEEPLSLEGYL